MDALTDIVGSLCLSSELYFRAEFSLPFAVRVPEDRRRIRFHVGARGRSWIGLPGGENTFYDAGDIILVPHGSAHVLAHAPETRAEGLAEVLAHQTEPGRLRLGDGDPSVELVCGHFSFDESATHPLIESLPPLLHIAAETGPGFAWVAPLLESIEGERDRRAPAHEAVTRRLSEVLLLQVLRAALKAGTPLGALAATQDPQLGRALADIHRAPERAWSVTELARTAGMSRSQFAARFRSQLGESPMRYIARWRMHRARELLADRSLSAGEVGRQVGYESEAAVNRAFKEATGVTPGRFRGQSPG